jgi:hypothetical protein
VGKFGEAVFALHHGWRELLVEQRAAGARVIQSGGGSDHGGRAEAIGALHRLPLTNLH